MKYLLILLLFACSKNKLELPEEDIGASSYLGDSFSESIAGYHSTSGGTDYRLFKVPNNFLRWQGDRRGSCNIDQSDSIDLSSLVWGYITQDTVPEKTYPRSYQIKEGMHWSSTGCNHIWIIPQPDTVVIPISPKITTKPWNPYSRYEKGPSLVCIKCHQEKQQVIFHKGNDLEPLPDSVQQIEVDPVTQVPTVIYNAPPIPRIVCGYEIYHKYDWIVHRYDADSLAYKYYRERMNTYIGKHFKRTTPTIWLELIDSGYNVGWHHDRHVAYQGLHIQIPRGKDELDKLERLVDFAIRNLEMLKDYEKAIRRFDPDIDPELANISQDLIEQVLQWDYRQR